MWAPKRNRVAVVVEPSADGGTGVSVPLEAEGDGYFSGLVPAAGPGTLYGFRLDGEERTHPDPASREQPLGPFGASRVVDPWAYRWGDDGWEGPVVAPVIYELHVGSFTPEGTWDAAREKLPHLADLGVSVLDVMPVADFPGRFGWGYDGVALFAPYHRYGPPDAFRRFVDTAHQLGLAVILDVVYNHVGPHGSCLGEFSDGYVSRRHRTDWGPAFNFDGPSSGPVRDFCRANVRLWIEEYRLDGFRFDATQDLHDDSPDHILGALAREARAAAAGRRTLLLAENEPQDSRLVRPPPEGGLGLDLVGNDDFHHTAVVALTGRREAYYGPYGGGAQELVSGAKHGFLYQGQWYPWQRQRRGTPTRGLPRSALVNYLENHDQVANSARGQRLHQLASPRRWRAMVALHLLGPQTPLLFQGQEFASSAPFLYFADQDGELADATRRGRDEFLRQFPSLAADEAKGLVPDPADPETFRRCRLDWSERDRNRDALALHRDLLRLRREDPTLSSPDPEVDGAVLAADAFVLRWFGARADGAADRLLLVNLGVDLHLSPAPEPLLAPPTRRGWEVSWSSERPEYGGGGTPPVETETWNLPGGCALVLAPAARRMAAAGGGP